MSLKESLYQHCLQYVQQRMAHLHQEIERAQTSANEETKSSAGDKYEVGRAMAQLDIDMYNQQLREAGRLQAALQNIRTTIVSDHVIAGSLVITSKGVYYIAISIGTVTLEGSPYFIISPDSPIGKLMMGKRVGDSLTFNNQTHTIQAIE